jgi:hypothetical protein
MSYLENFCTVRRNEALLPGFQPPQPPLHPVSHGHSFLALLSTCRPPQPPLHPYLSRPQRALQPCCLFLFLCRHPQPPLHPVPHDHRQLSSPAVCQPVSLSLSTAAPTPLSLSEAIARVAIPLWRYLPSTVVILVMDKGAQPLHHR